MDIEDLLRWAYVNELPKQGVSIGRGTPLSRMLDYGTTIDMSHREREPVVEGDPHPDALLLDYAVRNLPPARLTLPMARYLLGELFAYLTREVVREIEVGIIRRRHREIAGIVTREITERVVVLDERLVDPRVLLVVHAKLGNRPPWNLGASRVTRVLGRNGKPVVVGITKGRRYGRGAYSPLQLDPSAAAIVRARFEYVAWWMALMQLAESCRLNEHEPLPPRAAAEPWRTGPEPTSRILKAFSFAHSRLTTALLGAC